jgi:hypothetical protein
MRNEAKGRSGFDEQDVIPYDHSLNAFALREQRF